MWLVPHCSNEVYHKVYEAKYCQKPIETIKPPGVYVIGEPPLPITTSGNSLHNRDQEAANEETEGESGEEEAGAHRLHSFGGLSYEEIKLPRVYEGFPGAHEEELGDQEEYTDGESGCAPSHGSGDR